MTTNTKTRQTPRNAHEARLQEKEPSLVSRLTVLVNHVARSEEYRTLRSSKLPHTEAFSQAIDTILDSPDNGFNNLDTELLRTTASIGTFIEAQEELSFLEEKRSTHGRLSDDDYERTKELKLEYVIPFNHTLKSLINESPNVGISDFTSALAKTYQAAYGRYNALMPEQEKDAQSIIPLNEVMYRLKQITNGMRHEIAAETMLTAAGIAYDYDVSVEEDARGIDMVVYIDGQREPIDIKASFLAEDKARQKRGDSRAVWTELSREDFRGMKGNSDDALSIPYETAQYHAESFVDRIRTVIGFSNAHKAATARNIGRSARRY